VRLALAVVRTLACYVLRPVDHGRVETERGPISSVEALEQTHGPVHAKARLGLAVGAVQLDIAERPLRLHSSLLEAGSTFGPLTAQGKRVDEPLGGSESPSRPAQLALNLAAAGERPFRDDNRLTAVVVEGSFGEPAFDEVDELSIAQWVPDTRGDLVNGRPGWVGSCGCHRDQSCYNEIDGDDIHNAFWDPWELP